MRQSFGLLLICCLTLNAWAQGTGWDMQAFSASDISGTSRYVGLAGAMTALGGDVSAINDNPAALGVFHHSESSISFNWRISNIRQQTEQGSTISQLGVPQVSQVFSHHGSGLFGTSSNFAISYHRTAHLSRDWSGAMNQLASSQTDLMASQASGLNEQSLAGTSAYSDSEVGWLSKMAYDAYLIDPASGFIDEWVSCEPGFTSMSYQMEERGYIDAYSFAWGTNTNDVFYFGLLLNLKNLSYYKYVDYGERFVSGNSYTLSSSVSAKGFGADFGAGLIYRPTKSLRLGASVFSPTFMRITTRTSGSIQSNINLATEGKTTFSSRPNSTYDDVSSRKLPMRVTAGMAATFGTIGLITAEYDWQGGWESSLRHEHMLKMGAEVVLHKNLFLDLGYAAKLYGGFRDGEDYYLPSYNSARTDTDYGIDHARHFASLAASYRHQFIVFGVAYQFASQKRDFYAYANMLDQQEKPTYETYCHQSHNIVVSLALKY